MAFSARHLCNNVDQNVSNISNDGEYDCSAGICTGEAPGIVDLPSRNAKSKKKKKTHLAKITLQSYVIMSKHRGTKYQWHIFFSRRCHFDSQRKVRQCK